jgi:UDP-glucose 4-epimerase
VTVPRQSGPCLVAPTVTWLVTGGAGYIGAHVVRALRAVQQSVVVLDDLSTGIASRVPDDVPLIKADVRDRAQVAYAISRHRVAGVVHLAARKDVAESTMDPLGYYRDNLDGLRAVLEASSALGAHYQVFSSSAAVYGTPPDALVTEDSRTRPENAYGCTKLIGEWMLRDAAQAVGLRYVALRYFNVAGAGAPGLGDVGGSNLLPRLLRAVAPADVLLSAEAAQNRLTACAVAVHGTDYPTPDGSCVRDYVHVSDIAAAHAAAALALRSGTITGEVFNVGQGVGVSVLEMVDAVTRITGRPLAVQHGPRRPGDPARVVASAERIQRVLGWRAQHGLDDIVASAWAAFSTPA